MSIANNLDYLEITGVDLPALVKAAYSLSQPQGMGVMHFVEGDLPDQEAIQIAARADERYLNVDYLHGRAVKLSVFREDGRLFIQKRWYDHTVAQLAQLLTAIGMHQKISQL